MDLLSWLVVLEGLSMAQKIIVYDRILLSTMLNYDGV